MTQVRLRATTSALAVIVSAGAPLSAQSIGLAEHIGVNIATMTGEEAPETSPRAGTSWGGFFVVAPNRSFSVRLGLVYSTKGTGVAVQTFTDSSQALISYLRTVERTLTLQALEVPALVRFRLPVSGLWLGAGPVASINVRCRLRSAFTVEVFTDPNREVAGSSDCADSMEDVDWNLWLESGLDLPVGSGWVTVDARYAHGLSVAYRGSCDGWELDGAAGCLEDIGFDGKNRVFTLTVGVGFGWWGQ